MSGSNPFTRNNLVSKKIVPLDADFPPLSNKIVISPTIVNWLHLTSKHLPPPAPTPCTNKIAAESQYDTFDFVKWYQGKHKEVGYDENLVGYNFEEDEY